MGTPSNVHLGQSKKMTCIGNKTILILKKLQGLVDEGMSRLLLPSELISELLAGKDTTQAANEDNTTPQDNQTVVTLAIQVTSTCQ